MFAGSHRVTLPLGLLNLYLLDTNHCAWLINGNAAIAAKVRQVGEAQIATSVIVWGELVFMAHKSRRRDENLTRVRTFAEDIALYRIDETTADVYGAFKNNLLQRFGPHEKSRRDKTRLSDIGISDNDLWIASSAIALGLTVVSADSGFVRMQQVMPFPLEKWWDPGKTQT